MRETPDDRALIQRLYQEKAQELYFVAKRIVQDDLKAEEAVCTCFQKLSENLTLCRSQPYENLAGLSMILVKNAATKMAAPREVEVTQGKGNDLDKSEEDMDPKKTEKKLLACKEKLEVILEEMSA